MWTTLKWKAVESWSCSSVGVQSILSSFTPPHPPKIPAAAVQLCSEYNIKFYQQWYQMDDDKFMNCERVCLFWLTIMNKAQNWIGKLSKNDSQGPFHIEYYVIQNKWTHCALAIIIIHFFSPFSRSTCTDSKKLALWCPQQQNPLQCVVTSNSSISCILSSGVRNSSPVYSL